MKYLNDVIDAAVQLLGCTDLNLDELDPTSVEAIGRMRAALAIARGFKNPRIPHKAKYKSGCPRCGSTDIHHYSYAEARRDAVIENGKIVVASPVDDYNEDTINLGEIDCSNCDYTFSVASNQVDFVATFEAEQEIGRGEADTDALEEFAPVGDCPACGATLQENDEYPWHLPDEDCRAVRQPKED